MISHKNKFIFIHIPKTGGHSITTCLLGPQTRNNLTRHFGSQYPLVTWHTKHYLPNDYRRDYWEKYFRFTFVRNPWDRAVSLYEFRKSRSWIPPGLSFKCWLYKREVQMAIRKKINVIADARKNMMHPMAHDIMPQRAWLNFREDLDYIGRFETLQKDFDIICDKIKIPRRKLPHLNGTPRGHYTRYYDRETRELIGKLYITDIDYFGYEFENGAK